MPPQQHYAMPCLPRFADCTLCALCGNMRAGYLRLQSWAVLPSAFQCHRAGLHASVLLQIALELEKVALNDEYFIKRKLYPNVDFFSGELHQTCVATNGSSSTPVVNWSLKSCLQAAPGHQLCSWRLLHTGHSCLDHNSWKLGA